MCTILPHTYGYGMYTCLYLICMLCMLWWKSTWFGCKKASVQQCCQDKILQHWIGFYFVFVLWSEGILCTYLMTNIISKLYQFNFVEMHFWFSIESDSYLKFLWLYDRFTLQLVKLGTDFSKWTSEWLNCNWIPV